MVLRAGLTGTVAVLGSWLMVSSAVAQEFVTCTSNCARITVAGASGAPGNTPVTIKVSYEQGPDDSVAGKGNDDTAALAFTLGMPGVGTSTPLRLANCDINADGLTSAIRVAAGISENFKVVVENLQCTTVNGTPRSRCLCPGAGQQQDNFMNIVVYGPKDLPSSGPVDIPRVPSGDLLEVDLLVNTGGDHDLHVFAETDEQSTFPKPQFGAFLSIGDQAADDQTFDREASPSVSRVEIVNSKVTALASCVGDCNNDGSVTVDELVKGVNISLGKLPLSDCSAFDSNNNKKVDVNELTKGVDNALGDCGQ